MDQLVEVGLRALSSSRNDVFTTVSCIEHLSALFVELVQRLEPSACRLDEEGRLRVVAERRPAGEMIERAFDVIRQVRPGLPSVQRSLLEGLERLARVASDRRTCDVIRRQVRAIASDAQLIADVPGRRSAARRARLAAGRRECHAS